MNEDIDVFRVPGFGMQSDGDATDDEVLNLEAIECRQQIDPIFQPRFQA